MVTLETGTYHWCACGRSNNQPFCDGSHQGTAGKRIHVTTFLLFFFLRFSFLFFIWFFFAFEFFLFNICG
ncbi:MAG: CDGSH iron-sulfur domain-containing protein [Bacteroidales bacterium]|nr:CDGSH iron-sulfur domain-containing protein [Bacteroidales bacterium]